ncbi:MAG: AraC family transcriptional regulator ligand-binding domain-containing protein [Acidobacteriota bacterium]
MGSAHEVSTSRPGSSQQPNKTAMSTVRAVVAFAERCGLSLEEIAEELGVRVRTLHGFDGMVPDDRPARFMKRLEASGKDPALTLHIAERTPFSYFGGIERAAYYAPTVRAAMDTFLDFAWILSARLGSFVDESESYVAYHFPHPMGHLDNGMFREIAVAMFWKLIRESIGTKGGLAEISLGYTPNGQIDRYRAYFDTRVTFGVFPGDHVLVFSKDVLETANVHANPVLYRLGIRYLDEQVRLRNRQGFSTEHSSLRRAVGKAIRHGDYSVAGVARNLDLSVRSAQRLALGCGVTLREMIGENRIDLAKCMIADDPDISLGDLTEKLGYRDQSSFRRAFVRFSGVGVANFRRAFRSPSDT